MHHGYKINKGGKYETMKNKLFIIILIIVILQCFCGFVFAENINNETNEVTNQTLEEQKQQVTDELNAANTKLQYVQSELSATMLKIQELEDKVLQYKSELDSLQGQINELQTSINDATTKLETVEQDYNEKNELLKRRLVAIYEAGETQYLDILLSSRNIVDFISGYYLITELAEYDNKLIEEVEKQKNEIETTKLKLEREETQIKIVKAKKEQTTIVWQNTKTLQQNYVGQLSTKEKKLQEEITKYKEEQYRIETLIRQTANNNLPIDIQYTGGEMLWPVAVPGTYITSDYGVREHPIQGIVKEHTGIDIGNADYGAPVVAADDGVVTYAGWLGGYGNCVMINHGNGITTLYGHGQSVETSLHKEVKKGDLILRVGSTGNSTGPHLHFEVRYNGNCVDPLQFVKVP